LREILFDSVYEYVLGPCEQTLVEQGFSSSFGYDCDKLVYFDYAVLRYIEQVSFQFCEVFGFGGARRACS
jgi:hypothetical protein